MLIRMNETRAGSENGFNVRYYDAGEMYVVADGLARDFVSKGWAEEITLAAALEELSSAERRKAEEAGDTVYAAPYYAAAAAYAHAATLALRVGGGNA